MIKQKFKCFQEAGWQGSLRDVVDVSLWNVGERKWKGRKEVPAQYKLQNEQKGKWGRENSEQSTAQLKNGS